LRASKRISAEFRITPWCEHSWLQLQVWLKEKDPTFGGLVRVQNKRQEFLWVHPQFTSEY
jgi:hypothetical protein